MRCLPLLLSLAVCLGAQTEYRFQPRPIIDQLPGVETVAMHDLNGDSKPDLILAVRNRVLWAENPSWKIRTLAGGRNNSVELAVRSLPVGRVNRVRHLALISRPGPAVKLYRQEVAKSDPNAPALSEPVALTGKPWKLETTFPGGVKALAWADLDGDGSDELVTAGDKLTLHDRPADGRWTDERIDGGQFTALAAGDVDGDGLAEVAASLSAGSVVLYQNVSRVCWRRHVIAAGYMTETAIGADFTGDGVTDVIATDAQNGRTILYVAPGWKPVVLQSRTTAIHSEVMDADGDGDLDYIAARYTPGLIFWLENPADPIQLPWLFHVIDDDAQHGVNGIHGLTKGDVDRNGKMDLIANSAQPAGEFPNSLVWFGIPERPSMRWERHVFARGDAPGLSHYSGFGDVNGDGRGDIASAAKIPPDGNWFAWWEQPEDATARWTKHIISDHEPGATNIKITDVDGNGANDFIASRGHGAGLVWFEAPDWKAHPINTRLIGPHSLAVGDIDGDGDVDAVTCAKDSHIAAWFENDGHGRFTTHHIHENQASYDIRLVDMDGDGDLDVLNAGQESRNVVWFENRLR